MGERQTSRRGRAVIYAAFLGVLTYLSIAIIGSIVTEIYGRPPPPNLGRLSRPERTWCIRSLVDLKDELEGKVTLQLQRVAHGADPFERWRTFEGRWNERLAEARQRCVGNEVLVLDQGYAELEALYAGYAAVVDSMIKTQIGPATRLGEALGSLKKQP
ncbi:MAG: hypothetical protein HY903_10865 [Deltaproteobacteria bacterium]|nr:hypothetical protein [Deltaproteobacteria bacterium]